MILSLEDLSIVDSQVLESCSISVLLSISFLRSSKIFLIYFGAPVLDAYVFTMLMSSGWMNFSLQEVACLFMSFVLKSILSDINIAFFPVPLLGIFFS